MRQIADQLLVGLGLVHQALFAVLLGLLLQGQQLDNHLAGNICLGHHHMHRKRLGVGTFEPGVIAQGRKLVAAGAFERVAQDLRLGKAFGQLRAFDGAPGYAQGIFQGGIGKNDNAVISHHSNQRCKQVKGMKTDGGAARFVGGCV